MKKRIGWEFWQFLGKGFACCTAVSEWFLLF